MLLQSEITKKLSTAGNDYLRVGLDRFHSLNGTSNNNYQACIGNICIGTELLLKSIISDRVFIQLFSNLPLEVQVKLTDKKTGKFVQIPPYHRQNIENFTTKTIEFDQAIGIFYHLHPSAKQDFTPFLKTISGIRNISVHGAIPEFQVYNSEWIAYSAISLMKYLGEQNYHFLYKLKSTEVDEEFHKAFDSERNKRVQKAVKEAQNKAKNITPSLIDLIDDEWHLLVIECPICHSDAFLEGYSDIEYEQIDVDDADGWLNFYGESFECEECGLKLNGVEELELVRIESVHDRTDDIDAWLKAFEEEVKAEYLWLVNNGFNEAWSLFASSKFGNKKQSVF